MELQTVRSSAGTKLVRGVQHEPLWTPDGEWVMSVHVFIDTSDDADECLEHRFTSFVHIRPRPAWQRPGVPSNKGSDRIGMVGRHATVARVHASIRPPATRTAGTLRFFNSATAVSRGETRLYRRSRRFDSSGSAALSGQIDGDFPADVAMRDQPVIGHCPNVWWRLLVALARFGGLRTPSEPFSFT